MNDGIKKIFVFAAGAAIGSAVTWKLLKTKYERIAQEEIDSVKEVFAKLYSEKKDETSEEKTCEDDNDEEEPADAYMEEYLQHVNNYNGSENISRKEALETMRPHVISPDEYGMDDYETETLYYYTDGVLATAYDEPIGNIDDVVGLDALDEFGEYADNAVYVRNDRLRTDYEILRSQDEYTGMTDDENEYI